MEETTEAPDLRDVYKTEAAKTEQVHVATMDAMEAIWKSKVAVLEQRWQEAELKLNNALVTIDLLNKKLPKET